MGVHVLVALGEFLKDVWFPRIPHCPLFIWDSYEFEHAYATHLKLGQLRQRMKVNTHIRVNTHFGMAPLT